MALSDLVLKAKVNLALIRDPRVGAFDVGVRAEGGRVTLTGDADTEEECRAAEEIARTVEGVTSVRNDMTCGIGKREDTAEHVTQRLLSKLDEEWRCLPDQTALTQADYLRWALWLIYKFRIPGAAVQDALVANAMDAALTQVAGYVGAPKALLALEMLRQAEMVAESPHRDAPVIENALLVATPVVEGDPAQTAA